MCPKFSTLNMRQYILNYIANYFVTLIHSTLTQKTKDYIGGKQNNGAKKEKIYIYLMCYHVSVNSLHYVNRSEIFSDVEYQIQRDECL